MGQRSTTHSRRGGALVDSYKYAKAGRPKRRPRPSGKVVTYMKGDVKPILPPPR